MNLQQFKIYFHTLKYMKLKQINYRLFYTLRRIYRQKTKFRYSYYKKSKSATLILAPGITVSNSFFIENNHKRFHFLNLSHTFEKQIEWNFSKLGKLWTYNLNYFEYLLQEEINLETSKSLIYDFIDQIEEIKDGLEPFPIALRGINWIKFLTYHKIKEQKIDDSLYAQYAILMDNIEYHLLGNHLLENGFSLLFGGYYFADRKMYNKAKEILTKELEEQILSDGAHFELTPMYHQIMLFRVLDCINLIVHNTQFHDELFENFLREKAALMIGWLRNMTYCNGSIPHFNDSTDAIAPKSRQLFAYANDLGVTEKREKLGESGYRKFENDFYEMYVDIGNIGPDYIPGHAHSDTFNFELYVEGKPIVVDTGISTYEANHRRLMERSTSAHNTVMIDDLEQSEVWSSFRVARRAKVIECNESENSIEVTHDGYKRVGLLHTRNFHFENHKIVIVDVLKSNIQEQKQAVAYIHFAPEVEILNITENKIVTKNVIFSFEGLKKLELVDITLAKGYNKLIDAKAAKIIFNKKLLTLIDIIV
jgi:hypothetical protein